MECCGVFRDCSSKQHYYTFSTKEVPLLVQTHCLLWNQFCAHGQGNWLLNGTNNLLVENKELLTLKAGGGAILTKAQLKLHMTTHKNQSYCSVF